MPGDRIRLLATSVQVPFAEDTSPGSILPLGLRRKSAHPTGLLRQPGRISAGILPAKVQNRKIALFRRSFLAPFIHAPMHALSVHQLCSPSNKTPGSPFCICSIASGLYEGTELSDRHFCCPHEKITHFHGMHRPLVAGAILLLRGATHLESSAFYPNQGWKSFPGAISRRLSCQFARIVQNEGNHQHPAPAFE